MPIGYAMGLFGANMLFVMMLLFSLISYYVFKELMLTYEEDVKNRSPINERLIDDNESHHSEIMRPYWEYKIYLYVKKKNSIKKKCFFYF